MSKKWELALNMIVQNETDKLRAALESVRYCFDEFVCAWTGTNPETEKILKEFNAKIIPYDYKGKEEGKWIDDFSKARNLALDNTEAEYIYWMDADDVIQNSERIEVVCQNFLASKPDVALVWAEYLYDFDKDGNCVMSIWRERLFRKSAVQCVGILHENYMLKQHGKSLFTHDFKVKHNVGHDHIKDSAKRNIFMIERRYLEEKEKGDIDPITLYDFGRSLYAVQRYEEALAIFDHFIRVSRSATHKCTIYSRMGEIYRKNKKDYAKSFACASLMMQLQPLWPDGFLAMGETFYLQRNFEAAIFFLEKGLQMDAPVGTAPRDPMYYVAKPYCVLVYCYGNIGQYDKAIQAADIALKYYPGNEAILHMKKLAEKMKQQLFMAKYFRSLVEEAKINEKDKIKGLVDNVPNILKDHPYVAQIRKEVNPVKDKNRIIIYCGSTVNSWSPFSLKEGIGGSEEQVIYMAKHLSDAGWRVDVFNSCPQFENDDEPIDGVYYHPYWTYNPNIDKCKIFIGWRNLTMANVAPEGSNCYIWLHDVGQPQQWNPDIERRIKKIFVLSDYHKDTLDFIKDKSKIHVTRNGILGYKYNAPSIRDSNKCIYTSSPDRGLKYILDQWPKIKEARPEATLDVYYGFTEVYNEMEKKFEHLRELKQYCMQKFKELEGKGVQYLGMVSSDEIAYAERTAGLWLYPLNWPEISCINAMKAQAGGAVPITAHIAALRETVQWGFHPEVDRENELQNFDNEEFLNKWTDAVIEWLDPDKQESIRTDMRKWAISTYDFATVAKEWDNLFKSNKYKIQKPKLSILEGGNNGHEPEAITAGVGSFESSKL